jgi:hypothetical protein
MLTDPVASRARQHATATDRTPDSEGPRPRRSAPSSRAALDVPREANPVADVKRAARSLGQRDERRPAVHTREQRLDREEVRPRRGAGDLPYVPFVPDGSPLDRHLDGARDRRRHGARPAPAAERVPDEVKRAVQAAGGIARGIATAGSGPAASVARALKVGPAPVAAIINGGFAVHDTIREFQRSGLSQETVRTAAGGIGGVAGAFKGGALGATFGAAVGGPVGAVIGGAGGALIGGFVGSRLGQGAVDAVAGAARAIGDVGGRALDTARDVAGDVADTVSDAADAVGDAAGDAADAVADAVGGAIDSITPW